MGRKIFEAFMAESFSQWIKDIKPQWKTYKTKKRKIQRKPYVGTSEQNC